MDRTEEKEWKMQTPFWRGSQRERQVVQVKGCSPERHLGSNCTAGLHGRYRCTIIRSLAQAPVWQWRRQPASPGCSVSSRIGCWNHLLTWLSSAFPHFHRFLFLIKFSRFFLVKFLSSVAQMITIFIWFPSISADSFLSSVVLARCRCADQITWSGARLWCEHLWFWQSTKVEHSPAEWFCKNCGFTAAGRIGRPSPSESQHWHDRVVGISLKNDVQHVQTKVVVLTPVTEHVASYLKRKLYWVKQRTCCESRASGETMRSLF